MFRLQPLEYANIYKNIRIYFALADSLTGTALQTHETPAGLSLVGARARRLEQSHTRWAVKTYYTPLTKYALKLNQIGQTVLEVWYETLL